ncbi:MAG TPA: hypothetical protein VJQ82_18305 [Terriglobales bacterium]|nr:hypothetical protein [Terriglobales bacterium]
MIVRLSQETRIQEVRHNYSNTFFQKLSRTKIVTYRRAPSTHSARQESRAATVELLLTRYSRTFAEELGFKTADAPSPLFCLLTAALFSGARTSHRIATKTAHILFERGWTSLEKLARTTWEQRLAALDEGGYVRYDERTSTMLGERRQMLVERYGGDMRELRQLARRNPARGRVLLKEFKGVGEVGVNIFFREVQLVWLELFPFLDKRTLAGAKELGLPAERKALSAVVRSRRDFVRLVSALIRV